MESTDRLGTPTIPKRKTINQEIEWNKKKIPSPQTKMKGLVDVIQVLVD